MEACNIKNGTSKSASVTVVRMNFGEADLKAAQLERLADQHTAEWMASMYRGLDVLVMASLGEGFSVPVIESMACGTPVIASRNSALVDRECPWYAEVQPTWNKLHNAWWASPLISDLAQKLEFAYTHARSAKSRADAARDSWKYTPNQIVNQWDDYLRKWEAESPAS